MTPEQAAAFSAAREHEEEALASLEATLAALPKAQRRAVAEERDRRDRFVADRLGVASLDEYLRGKTVDVEALADADRAFDEAEAETPEAKRERREWKASLGRATSTRKPAATPATRPSPAPGASPAADHTPEPEKPRRRLRAGHGGYLII